MSANAGGLARHSATSMLPTPATRTLTRIGAPDRLAYLTFVLLAYPAAANDPPSEAEDDDEETADDGERETETHVRFPFNRTGTIAKTRQ